MSARSGRFGSGRGKAAGVILACAVMLLAGCGGSEGAAPASSGPAGVGTMVKGLGADNQLQVENPPPPADMPAAGSGTVPGDAAAGTPGDAPAGTAPEAAAGTPGDAPAGTSGDAPAGTSGNAAAGTAPEAAAGTSGNAAAGTSGYGRPNLSLFGEAFDMSASTQAEADNKKNVWQLYVKAFVDEQAAQAATGVWIDLGGPSPGEGVARDRIAAAAANAATDPELAAAAVRAADRWSDKFARNAIDAETAFAAAKSALNLAQLTVYAAAHAPVADAADYAAAGKVLAAAQDAYRWALAARSYSAYRAADWAAAAAAARNAARDASAARADATLTATENSGATGANGADATGTTPTGSASASQSAASATVTPAAASVPQATLTVSNTTTTVQVGTIINLTTSGGSGGGSVTFAVRGVGCSVLGASLRATSAGTCIVTAKKAASPGYREATSMGKTIAFTELVP